MINYHSNNEPLPERVKTIAVAIIIVIIAMCVTSCSRILIPGNGPTTQHTPDSVQIRINGLSINILKQN